MIDGFKKLVVLRHWKLYREAGDISADTMQAQRDMASWMSQYPDSVQFNMVRPGTAKCAH